MSKRLFTISVYIIIGMLFYGPTLAPPPPELERGGEIDIMDELRRNGYGWFSVYEAFCYGDMDIEEWMEMRGKLRRAFIEESSASAIIQAGPTGIRYTGGR